MATVELCMLLVRAETRCLSPRRKNDHRSTNETIREKRSNQKGQETSQNKIIKSYPQTSEIRNIRVCVETCGHGNKKLDEMLKSKLKSSLS